MLSFVRNSWSVSSKCTILHCYPCSYCSTSSPGFGVFSVLDFGDSDRGVMVSPCFFNLHFLDDIPPVIYCWSSSAFYCLLRLNSKWPDWIFILICPIHSLLNKLRFRLLPLKTPLLIFTNYLGFLRHNIFFKMTTRSCSTHAFLTMLYSYSFNWDVGTTFSEEAWSMVERSSVEFFCKCT